MLLPLVIAIVVVLLAIVIAVSYWIDRSAAQGDGADAQ